MVPNQIANMKKTLSVKDFEEVFQEKLSPTVSERIQKYSFQYAEFSPGENDALLKKIVETLLDPNIIQSGKHRIDQWESGWGENLKSVQADSKDVNSILPKYFSKYGAIRWNGRFIRPLSEQFEYRSLAVILDWLFDQHARDVNSIYEFGCGPGYNLLRAREFNSSAKLFGLDWTKASQKIIEKLSEDGIDKNIFGHNFDYFNPDISFSLEPESLVFTVASLEQVGDRWGKFIDYLLQKRPKLCIHIEPIAELLNPEKFVDYLSIEYFKKRNYLNGFLDGLRDLEAQGKIKIRRAQRTHIGSLFIEGYSVVVWSPIDNN